MSSALTPKAPEPDQVELIGNEVAIKWTDGRESYFPMSLLRAVSPSAENQGEPDLLGNRIGGHPGGSFEGVTVLGWDIVGGYGLQFRFSDGHRTGIFSYSFLLRLHGELENPRRC